MPCFAYAYAVKPDDVGVYAHFLGGATQMANPNPFAGKAAPHLLYELSMADSYLYGLPFARSVSIQLVHPFRYNGRSLAYQSVRDGALVLGADNVGAWANYDATNANPLEDWPYADYPAAFQRRPVALEKVPAKSVLHATPDMPAVIVGELIGALDQAPDAVGIEDLPNIDDALDNLCPSASCRQRAGAPQPMQLFAIVPSFPAPGLSLWGEFGDYVWVVFCVCPRCCTVLTYNITD